MTAVVAGLSLKNLQPRVWDPDSPYYLPDLRAVMLSYADFHAMPARRRQAMDRGLRDYLGAPPQVAIYLDNGAFYFLRRDGETPVDAYREFVDRAKPDWWPPPQDYIPHPAMSEAEQRACMEKTLAVDALHAASGDVPVIHVGRLLDEYVAALKTAGGAPRGRLALGGIVPNLLRAPKALPYDVVLAGLRHARVAFADAEIHVFGLGGTATIHIAALLGLDSADSSGWRNRAARGIVQLPGSGDRVAADLGSWRGRPLDAAERETLVRCPCPACRRFGVEGLAAQGLAGFCNRAAHNLHVLLAEQRAVDARLRDGSYGAWHAAHLQNTIYLPLIRRVFALTARGAATATPIADAAG